MAAALVRVRNAVMVPLTALRLYCRNAMRNPETTKIAIEFCTEIAVLVAVFPLLDTLINKGPAQARVSTVAAYSLGIAAAFFVFAVIMAVRKEG